MEAARAFAGVARIKEGKIFSFLTFNGIALARWMSLSNRIAARLGSRCIAQVAGRSRSWGLFSTVSVGGAIP